MAYLLDANTLRTQNAFSSQAQTPGSLRMPRLTATRLSRMKSTLMGRSGK